MVFQDFTAALKIFCYVHSARHLLNLFAMRRINEAVICVAQIYNFIFIIAILRYEIRIMLIFIPKNI